MVPQWPRPSTTRFFSLKTPDAAIYQIIAGGISDTLMPGNVDSAGCGQLQQVQIPRIVDETPERILGTVWGY